MFTEDYYFLRTWRRTVDFSDSSGTTFKKNKEEAHIIKIEKKKKIKVVALTQNIITSGVLPPAVRKCKMDRVLL